MYKHYPYDDVESGIVASATECTGLVPTSPDSIDSMDSYTDMYDVPLPRNSHTDPSYMECLVSHEYGLYTQAAKKAREAKDAASVYRHWTLSGGAGDSNSSKDHTDSN